MITIDDRRGKARNFGPGKARSFGPGTAETCTLFLDFVLAFGNPLRTSCVSQNFCDSDTVLSQV